MPNCPVCGKEVQSTTVNCPACGTSLKQTPPSSFTQGVAYSPNYSYSQPGTGMPTPSQPHSHRKYILAIISVGLIALIVGSLVTSTLLIGPDVTDVTGTVSLGSPYSSLYHGISNRILFNSAVTGNLSSGVFPNKSYQVYLPILTSGNYAVTIQWTNVTAGAVSFYTCAANPSTFSSTSQNVTQNFSC
jgi:uncharacterized OB-fold protein